VESPDVPDTPDEALAGLTRDLAEVPAIEVVTACAVNLMSAAAVKLGLAEDGEHLRDLDEARRLIEALAGLVDGAGTYLSFHAAPVKDGLRTLQVAFREASAYPDEPGKGPGEKYTGPVW
jgi:hypothetical protein